MERRRSYTTLTDVAVVNGRAFFADSEGTRLVSSKEVTLERYGDVTHFLRGTMALAGRVISQRRCSSFVHLARVRAGDDCGS